MSSKQVKAALKSAKLSIQQKDFQVALNHCKVVLENDAKNYNGLIFSGLCYAELQNVKESLICYNNAIVADQCQPLAFQGIVKLYTKHWNGQLNEENLLDLAKAYESLIALTERKDDEKRIDLVIGLSKTWVQLNKYSDVLALIKYELSLFPSHMLLKLQLISCLENTAAFKIHDINTHSVFIWKEVSDVCQDNESDLQDREAAFQILLNFCKAFPKQLESNSIKLLDFCVDLPKSTHAQDTIFEIYFQKYKSEGDVAEFFSKYSGKYEKLKQCVALYREEKFEELAILMKDGMFENRHFVPGWKMFCETSLKLHNYHLAENSARSALQECKRMTATDQMLCPFLLLTPLTDLKLELTLLLAHSLSASSHAESLALAVATYEKLLKIWPKNVEVLVGLLKALVAAGDYGKAKCLMTRANQANVSHPEFQCANAHLMFLEGEKEEAVSKLATTTAENPQCFRGHFLLGKLMWETSERYRKDRKKCFSAFLNAAKLDVYHGETFFYLGRFYQQIANDAARAIKCYQKSYKLSAENEQAGISLADMYISQDDVEAAISLYVEITDRSTPGACKWAWLRLGLCRLKRKQTELAIKCFQAVLRTDPDDHVCWECLGEGYMARGSFTAAWKTFERARQLHPQSIFAIYQMAIVKQMLGQFTEAASEFKQALLLSPLYVPALKGLAEANLSVAGQLLRNGRDITSLDHVTEAIEHLATALTIRADLSCLWRLLADCCAFVHPLDGARMQLTIPQFLTDISLQMTTPQITTSIWKTEALRLSSTFYVHALLLCKRSATLWHDLGLSYYRRAAHERDCPDSRALAGQAIELLKRAVEMEPRNHVLWNALGVVASDPLCQNPSLAQHSFIKSIAVEPNNPTAWSNLASLYLTNSQFQLAHEAYKVAQSLQPAFACSWVGQALIAEAVGSDEAMGLFRHSLELGFHDLSATGYAWWVCHVVVTCRNRMTSQRYKDEIREMRAIATALPNMFQFCGRNPNCSWAWTLLGFLQEEEGLHAGALSSYKHALDCCVCDDVTSSDDVTSVHLNDAMANYGRMLSANSKHDEASATYRRISPLTDPYHMCALACSLHHAAHFHDAVNAFRQARELVTNGVERTLITVAMATTHWNSGDRQQAKEVLGNCDDRLSCAAALLESNSVDFERLSCALERKVAASTTCSVSLVLDCLVTVCVLDHVTTGSRALRAAQRFVHRFPHDWRPRDLLARVVRGNGAVGRHHASTCSGQTRRNFTADELASSPVHHHVRGAGHVTHYSRHDWSVRLAHAHSLLAVARHRFGNSPSSTRCEDAMREAQKLVHRHPASIEGWALLSSAAQAHHIFLKLKKKSSHQAMAEQCRRISSHIGGIPRADVKMRKWAHEQNVVSCVMQRRHRDVIFEGAEIESGRMKFLTAWEDCVRQSALSGHVDNAAIEHLRNTANWPGTDVAQLTHAAHVMECVGRGREASELLTAGSFQSTRLALRTTGWEATARWRDGVDTCVRWMMEGLVRRRERNHKKVRHCLHRALTCPGAVEYCASRCVSAWTLYRAYHDKYDHVELEKLSEKWKETTKNKDAETRNLLVRLAQLLSAD